MCPLLPWLRKQAFFPLRLPVSACFLLPVSNVNISTSTPTILESWSLESLQKEVLIRALRDQHGRTAQDQSIRNMCRQSVSLTHNSRASLGFALTRCQHLHRSIGYPPRRGPHQPTRAGGHLFSGNLVCPPFTTCP